MATWEWGEKKYKQCCEREESLEVSIRNLVTYYMAYWTTLNGSVCVYIFPGVMESFLKNKKLEKIQSYII